MLKGCNCSIIGGGLESEDERADIIKFLKVFTKGLAKNLRVRANK